MTVQRKTPRRAIGIPTNEWEAFVGQSEKLGTNASARIRKFVRRELGLPTDET